MNADFKMNDQSCDQLADYIDSLCRALNETRRAEDRSLYVAHLAAAAMMFRAVHASDKDGLAEVLNQEEANFGRAFLSGSSGEMVEKAFTNLKDALLRIVHRQ